MKTIAMLLLAGAVVAPAQQEKKKVVCTLPALRAIAAEVAGPDFDVTALARPDDDPHKVNPTPSLAKALREADVFIEIGMQLELWSDELANNSGNPRIQKGGKGRVVASTGITREEVPTVMSRSEGADLHPEGNPHLWLDPLRVKDLADNIAAALKAADPGTAEAVETRLDAFKKRIDETLFGADLIKAVGSRVLIRKARDGSLWAWLDEKGLMDKAGGWLGKARSLKGQAVVEYHRTWIYLAKTLGMRIVGNVEPKPGIPATARHIEDLKGVMAAEKVKLIIVDTYFDPTLPRSIAERTEAKVAVARTQPADGEDYFRFMDGLVDRLVEGLK